MNWIPGSTLLIEPRFSNIAKYKFTCRTNSNSTSITNFEIHQNFTDCFRWHDVYLALSCTPFYPRSRNYKRIRINLFLEESSRTRTSGSDLFSTDNIPDHHPAHLDTIYFSFWIFLSRAQIHRVICWKKKFLHENVFCLKPQDFALTVFGDVGRKTTIGNLYSLNKFNIRFEGRLCVGRSSGTNSLITNDVSR